MRRFIVAAMVAATALTGLAVAGVGASAESDPKVIVCKFVSNENAPGGEVFGQVIDVSANALDGFDPNLPFPQTFTDDQGRSVAVRYATGPGDKGNEVTDCDQPAPPTSTVPPPPPPPITTTVTTPPPTTTTPPPACPGSVDLGPWYGDPRVNIDLTGEGDFVVRGGIQRFSNTRIFRVSLDCHETLRIGRYKIKAGHFLTITLDGVRVVYETPPAV